MRSRWTRLISAHVLLGLLLLLSLVRVMALRVSHVLHDVPHAASLTGCFVQPMYSSPLCRVSSTAEWLLAMHGVISGLCTNLGHLQHKSTSPPKQSVLTQNTFLTHEAGPRVMLIYSLWTREYYRRKLVPGTMFLCTHSWTHPTLGHHTISTLRLTQKNKCKQQQQLSKFLCVNPPYLPHGPRSSMCCLHDLSGIFGFVLCCESLCDRHILPHQDSKNTVRT